MGSHKDQRCFYQDTISLLEEQPNTKLPHGFLCSQCIKMKPAGLSLIPNDGPSFQVKTAKVIRRAVSYILRSLSDHPVVKDNRLIVHIIGVTGGDIKKRVANAKHEPTFLMADIEVIATYKLANISRTKFEKIIHRFFSSAKLDIEIKDRFGKPVKAREWFLVSVFIIDEMVEKIKDGTVSDYYYDPASAKLKKHSST